MVVSRRESSAVVELLSVETSVPRYTVTSDDTRSRLPMLAGARRARFEDTIEHVRVDRRHSVLPFDEIVQLRAVSERARAYETHALELAEGVARAALYAAAVNPTSIGTFISASCTGYMLPSLDAHLIPKLGIGSVVRRIPITELGCSA